MSLFVGFVLMAAAALLQVTWAPHLAIGGAFPNLVLVGVVSAAWCRGVRAGMWWACAGGLLLDLTATGPLGPHALALLCGAYLTASWAGDAHGGNLWHPMLAAAASTVAYSLILVAADDLVGLPVPRLAVAVQLTLGACAYNAALVPLGLHVVRRFGPSAVAAA